MEKKSWENDGCHLDFMGNELNELGKFTHFFSEVAIEK